MHFLSFISLGGALLLLPFSLLYAQADWTPPIKEKYALLQDYCGEGNYRKAFMQYQWIVSEKPDLHENVYILGIKSIKGSIEGTANGQSRNELISELGRAYDLRTRYFGSKEKLSLRKALDLYALGSDSEDILKLKLAAFDSAFVLNPVEISSQFLLAYMDVTSKVYNEKLITEDEVIDRYLNIKDGFYRLVTLEKNAEDVNKHQLICDQIFLSLVQLDCATIKQMFADDFLKNKNAGTAKIIVKLCITYKCTNEAYFEEALDVYYETTPSYLIATYLGNKMRAKGNRDLAEKYYKDMKSLAENHEQEAKAYLLLASLYFNFDKRLSRSYLNKVLELQPEMKEAYKMWGDLYYNSFEDCKKEVSHVEDRSVYLAAYEKYKKAGDTAKMKLASSQFPAIDNIHMEPYNEGQEIICGCWINETVVVRRRPAE